jgi:hypothetical protein
MNSTQVASFDSDLGPTRRRLERNTYLVLAAMLVVSLIIGKWKIILGVALGGLLGLLNIRWLEASLGVIISGAQLTGQTPKWTAGKFILRYLIIGLVISLALWSGYFNILAIIAGFCAFVWAVMIEAGYQICRMIAHTEE